MTGIVAYNSDGTTPSGATGWTTGQRIVMGDSNLTSWSGTNWVGGAAPLAEKKVKKNEE